MCRVFVAGTVSEHTGNCISRTLTRTASRYRIFKTGTSFCGWRAWHPIHHDDCRYAIVLQLCDFIVQCVMCNAYTTISLTQAWALRVCSHRTAEACPSSCTEHMYMCIGRWWVHWQPIGWPALKTSHLWREWKGYIQTDHCYGPPKQCQKVDKW